MSVEISTVVPIVIKIAKRIYEADNDHFYGLQEQVSYGVIRTERFKAFDYEDELFIVKKIDEYRSDWTIKPFEPETKFWNATSNLPDHGTKTLECLFLASLFHDCGYEKVEAISKATGIPEDTLLAFFDDCFKILSEGYGASKKVTNPIYQALRCFGSLYHKIRKLIAIAILVSLISGCYSLQTEMENPTPPDIHWYGPYFPNGESK